MTIQLLATLVAFALVAVWFMALRRGKIREKYAAQWIVLGLISVILALYPPLLNSLARFLGIADPPNLLAFLGIWFLIAVVAHLTMEVNTLEDRVRVLAEEIALLKVKAKHPDQVTDESNDGRSPSEPTDPLPDQ